MKSKKQKQNEAIERAEARAKRTASEQLMRLSEHGWAAKKERAKLIEKGGVE